MIVRSLVVPLLLLAALASRPHVQHHVSSGPAQQQAAPKQLVQEQAIPAHVFADSLGINLHLSYDGTLYKTNLPLVLASLQDLRVHHVRDGLVDFGPGPNPFYTALHQLAYAGIHADLITSVGQDEALWQAYPARVGGLEALEAPNEYDTHGDPHWADTLRAFLPLLHHAVHGPQPMPGVTLIGPSLVNQQWNSATGNAHAQLGPVSGLFDVGNLHNYPGDRNPGTLGWTPEGYGSIPFAIASARHSWADLPLVTTETGFRDDPGAPDSLPDDVIARYTPRLLLEQFLHGIRRTYLYELADDPSSGGLYGLLRADGSPKPAYAALANLMHLVADSDNTPANAASLRFGLSSADTTLHHLLLVRSDGSFLLALWLETPAFDVDTRKPILVPPQSVHVRFAHLMRLAAVHQWQPDGTMHTTPRVRTAATLDLPISDLLTVLEVQEP